MIHGMVHVYCVLYIHMFYVLLNMYLYMHIGKNNVWKQIQKITEVRARDRGVNWFHELVDKSEYTYYLWWAPELFT